MSRSKILIIDDEPILQKAIRKSLAEQNYDLYFAADGREGLKLFHEKSPDLIFLDIKMPIMNGFEFLQAIDIKPGSRFSVVVITGHGADEDIQKSYKLGAHCFLRKPLNMLELCSLAERCITFKKMENEREQLICELEEALATIKTLNGLLPICASCKKIRDQEDLWHEIDTYISTHTDADFSHSICPDCVKELYPGISKKIAARKKEESKVTGSI